MGCLAQRECFTTPVSIPSLKFSTNVTKLYGNTPRNCLDVQQARQWGYPEEFTVDAMNVIMCTNPSESSENLCIDGNPSNIFQMRLRLSAVPPFNWIFFPSLGSEDSPPAPNGGAWLRAPESNATVGYCLPYPGDRQECRMNPSGGSAPYTIYGERRFRCTSEWTADDVNDPRGYMNKLGEACREEWMNGSEAYLACVKKPFETFCAEAVKATSTQPHRWFCDEVNGYKSWWQVNGTQWVQGDWTI